MTPLEGLINMDIMIMEIFPRLPTKTLISLKSVCKSLNSLISSRDFTRLYLRHHSFSSSAADKRLILTGNGRINCYHLDPHATTPTTSFVYGEQGPVMSVIGTSNGLLCIGLIIRAFFSEYCILNPTTGIYLGIRTLHEYLGAAHNYGFGFDHENLDYIIVVVSEYRNCNNPALMTSRITRVYSLNKNCWRVVNKITFPKDTMEVLKYIGVLIDNSLLHWMFRKHALGKYRIGCFDICKNKWTDDVLLPRFYYDQTCNEEINLVDLGLDVDDCLSSTFKDRIENRYNVWVMKEYGVQDSWVMLLSIPDFNCFKGEVINPIVCCQSSDMALVRQPYTNKFFWYNKVDGGISKVKFDEAPDPWNLQAFMCSKSLVHLPDGHLFEHSI